MKTHRDVRITILLMLLTATLTAAGALILLKPEWVLSPSRWWTVVDGLGRRLAPAPARPQQKPRPAETGPLKTGTAETGSVEAETGETGPERGGPLEAPPDPAGPETSTPDEAPDETADLEHVASEPAATAAPEAASADAIALDAAPLVVGDAPASAEDPAPAAPPPSIDYARLNRDIHTVADALERFNGKLLRVIAQLKSEQERAEMVAERPR